LNKITIEEKFVEEHLSIVEPISNAKWCNSTSNCMRLVLFHLCYEFETFEWCLMQWNSSGRSAIHVIVW